MENRTCVSIAIIQLDTNIFNFVDCCYVKQVTQLLAPTLQVFTGMGQRSFANRASRRNTNGEVR